MKKVIILDFGYIQHRAIFAFRHNCAVPVTYTILKMIVGYLKKIGMTPDDLVIVAQDYGSWRKLEDKNYKAQRKDYRESLEDADWWKEVYREVNEFVQKLDTSLCWQICKLYNCEADDWISVACRYYTDREIIIVSSDRDLEQLCYYKNVKIFSPMTKKYKLVKNPMKVLMEKIQGDISDNLIDKPSNEAEFELRKKIVDLINPLPDHIEKPLLDKLKSFLPKNIYLHKLPYKSVSEDIARLYRLT